MSPIVLFLHWHILAEENEWISNQHGKIRILRSLTVCGPGGVTSFCGY